MRTASRTESSPPRLSYRWDIVHHISTKPRNDSTSGAAVLSLSLLNEPYAKAGFESVLTHGFSKNVAVSGFFPVRVYL